MSGGNYFPTSGVQRLVRTFRPVSPPQRSAACQISVHNSAAFPIQCEIGLPTELALTSVSGDSVLLLIPALTLPPSRGIISRTGITIPNRNHHPKPESRSRTEIIVPKLLPNPAH